MPAAELLTERIENVMRRTPRSALAGELHLISLDWPLDAIRISDLSEVRNPVDTVAFEGYLRRLRSSMLFALCTVWVAGAVGVVVLSDFILFLRDNEGFLHPWLAVFLLLTSLFLIVLGVLSGLFAEKSLKSTVRRICGV